MRKYKVICTQVSGIGKLLFNYGQEATEEQLINPIGLVKSGAIIEVEETKEEAKKRIAAENEAADKAKLEAMELAEKTAKEAAEKEAADKAKK